MIKNYLLNHNSNTTLVILAYFPCTLHSWFYSRLLSKCLCFHINNDNDNNESQTHSQYKYMHCPSKTIEVVHYNTTHA